MENQPKKRNWNLLVALIAAAIAFIMRLLLFGSMLLAFPQMLLSELMISAQIAGFVFLIFYVLPIIMRKLGKKSNTIVPLLVAGIFFLYEIGYLVWVMGRWLIYTGIFFIPLALVAASVVFLIFWWFFKSVKEKRNIQKILSGVCVSVFVLLTLAFTYFQVIFPANHMGTISYPGDKVELTINGQKYKDISPQNYRMPETTFGVYGYTKDMNFVFYRVKNHPDELVANETMGPEYLFQLQK